ncbi:hypothetical protein CF_4 [Curtobacterium phage Ayka]|nr:hypothetical protein CF_4 [Curtobacterium phage Ayka]
MAEKTAKTPVPAELKRSQVAPAFLPSQLAHIREARFVKRADSNTSLAYDAVLAYIKDVPKTDEVLELEAAEAAALAGE